jgi:hypothetical protein
MTTLLPAGPDDLGLELSADAIVSADGWLVRELHAAPGLDGPPGILQGGFAAGVCVAIARAADPHGAPLTSLDARLHAPTPMGRTLQARVRATDAAARYEVETRDGDTLLVSAEVELAGHEPAARAFDLLELARVPVPPASPQDAFPTCWVCGQHPTHPLGQRLHPRYHSDEAVAIPWVAEEQLGDARGMIDPLVICAVLDCPTVWASMGHVRSLGHRGALLAGYHLTMFRDAPTMEVLRTVARFDSADGRKIRARGALVDDEGVTYAVSSAFHISVPAVPAGQGE